MTISDLLDILDGAGLVVTDDDELEAELSKNGLTLGTDISFEGKEEEP